MKKIALSIILLSSVCFNACRYPLLVCGCDEHDVYLSKMFISSYLRMKRIYLEKGSENESDFIYIKYDTSPYASIADKDPTCINRLAEKHHDTDYNRKITYTAGTNSICHVSGGRYGITPDITRISIKSDSDFDAEHPAGTSLNDIVRLYSTSVYPYIKSGYTETFDWGTDTTGCFDYLYLDSEDFPIDVLLSEIDAETLIMAAGFVGNNNYGKLKFTTLPTLSKQHRLTIEMESDEGKLFTASLDLTF